MLVTELQMGGAAKVVREVTAMLARRFEVHEAVFNTADGVDFPGLAAPHSLDVGGGGGPLTKAANLARRVRRARELKRRLGTDVSISHLEGAHYVDALSRGREKLVMCIHGTMLRDHERGPREWVRRKLVVPWVYRRADRVVTVSRDIGPQMVKFGVDPERVVTINNSFDLKGIEAKAREPLPPAMDALFDGPPVIVTAGRLAFQKNQRPLLDIFARLRERVPCRLVILGDGPLREELLAHARSLGLRLWDAWSGSAPDPEAEVLFLGVEANPFRFIARSRLFVLTSGFEGFPLALCEAMVCSTPVVSADCWTGPREILAPETAMRTEPLTGAEPGPFGVLMPLLHLAETEEPAKSAWVETLAALLADRAECDRLGRAGRERMSDFSRERIAAQWEALVDGLLAEGVSPR